MLWKEAVMNLGSAMDFIWVQDDVLSNVRMALFEIYNKFVVDFV